MALAAASARAFGVVVVVYVLGGVVEEWDVRWIAEPDDEGGGDIVAAVPGGGIVKGGGGIAGDEVEINGGHGRHCRGCREFEIEEGGSKCTVAVRTMFLC